MALVSDDEGCKHLVWPASSCTMCSGKDKVKSDVWSEPFRARYPGGCPGCGLNIKLGDSIVIHRPTKRVYHEGCESE